MENHEGYANQAFRAETHEASPVAKKFDILKEKFNSLKLTEVIGDKDRAKIGEKSRDFFDTFSRGYRSVEHMEEIAGDVNKTETQKQAAMDDLDLLGKVVYESVREDEKFSRFIGEGSANKIDENLPEEFRGIGKVVLTNVFEEGPVLNALKELDENRAELSRMPEGATREKLTRGMVNKTIRKLVNMKDLTPGQKHDRQMSLGYLGAELEKFGEGKKNEEKAGKKNNKDNTNEGLGESPLIEKYLRENAEYAKASAEYARSRGILEEQVQEVSLEEILDSYLMIRAPRERAPQMWEYRVPDFVEGMSQKKWRKLLNFEDAWLGAIYNKRMDSAYNNSLEKMKDEILSMRSLAEGDFKTWYEDETLNLRGVMHQISRDLLIEKTVTQGTLTRKIYVFDTRVNPKTNEEEYVDGGRVKEFVDNEDTYKTGLVSRLVEKKIVSNKEVAKLAVALSMDIMEMGGVFSLADGLRKLSWESDAVRLAQRPERKYSLKVSKGELFAGPWTELANTLSGGDAKKAVELVKSWGVVPDLLSGSFLDQKLRLSDGTFTKRTMMEMIYQDEKIPFRNLENDMFYTWRKDHIMPAARMWMYISNRVPLEFSKNREDDAVISQWRIDLYNDIAQLRKNDDSLLPTSVVEGAIGGSVGLWPFEGPYLRINNLEDPNRVVQYMQSATEILRQLGLDQDEYNSVLRFFGIDKKYFNDLNHKMVAYTASRNVTLPRWYKNKANKTLYTERPKK